MTINVLSTLVLSAVGYLPPAVPLQDSPTDATVIAERPSAIRMELSGPLPKTYVWAASEWTLRFENASGDGMPCSYSLLRGAGLGGAFVRFEVAKAGETARTFTIDASGNTGCERLDSSEVLASGHSAELPVVLHGEMRYDFEAAFVRNEKVDTRFVPVFDTPGSYTVTAVLRWNRTIARSNSVKIDVADAPTGSERALEALEELARAGVWVDVTGLSYIQPRSDLERVAEFVEREKHTLYGAQLQVGLAQAFLGTAEAFLLAGHMQRNVDTATAALDRAKALVAHDPPVDIGLERSVKRVRERLALAERKAARARKDLERDSGY